MDLFRAWKLFLVCCLCLGCLSCATRFGGPKALPVDAAAGDILVDVPLVRQDDDALCGLAALEMVLRYYGKELDLPWRHRLVEEAKASGGIQGKTLKDCAVALGFSAAIFKGLPDHSKHGVFRYLERDIPLLLMLDLDRQPVKHYVVLVGYQKGANSFTILDPASGSRQIPAKNLIGSWQRAGYFTLLAFPRS